MFADHDIAVDDLFVDVSCWYTTSLKCVCVCYRGFGCVLA